jgi:hypothetical protein
MLVAGAIERSKEHAPWGGQGEMTNPKSATTVADEVIE